MAAIAHDEDTSHSPALESLLTADQSILLNTVDRLRSHGVSKYIKLPQIIVCGDQSSGKSSVLEAISHISFPRGQGVCTTFPTELALRRDPERTVKVQLRPSASRPEPERLLLASYQPPVGQLQDFEPLVTKAKEHLKRTAGNDRRADSFFEDTLHVEVTDPKWPPLSLVDLPGLISAPNPQQTQDDVTVVNDLVSKYMENPKSIILAVISASYELPLQKVFTMINKYDPLGKRTICVVTKPDIASPGSDDLPQFIQYAKNTLPGYRFNLGWHVVMNRGHETQSLTLDERDKAEKDFFSRATWSRSLHRDQYGIQKLRDRLSNMLELHTRAEMPGVMNQIKEILAESRDELSKLGPARSSSNDQRLHLTTISQRFENLVRQATNGHYDDPSFFLPALPESDPRKLRAAVQNLNESFAKRMRNRGHAKRIMGDKYSAVADWPSSTPTLQFITANPPEIILRSEYIQHIKALSRQNRGCELIGSPNLRLVRDLFLDQSQPWRGLATEHVEDVLQVVISHLSAVADNVAAPETAAALRREVVYDAMDTRHKRVMTKLEELLKPHEKGHPITYDLSYVESSRNLVKADVKARLEKYQHQNPPKTQNSSTEDEPQKPHGLQVHEIISALKLDSEEIEEIDCTDILNSMQAYYGGALRTFIDNVAVLAIEGCLIDGLESIFSATDVVNMDKQKLRVLGGESDQAQAERRELEQKVTALKDAQRECLRAGALHERQFYESSPSFRVKAHPTAQNRSATVDVSSVPSQPRSSTPQANTEPSRPRSRHVTPTSASSSPPVPKSTRTGCPSLFDTAFPSTVPTPKTGGLFGAPDLFSSPSPAFGLGTPKPPQTATGAFGTPPTVPTPKTGGLFGAYPSSSSSPAFGFGTPKPPQTATGAFSSSSTAPSATLFGAATSSSKPAQATDFFGGAAAYNSGGNTAAETKSSSNGSGSFGRNSSSSAFGA